MLLALLDGFSTPESRVSVGARQLREEKSPTVTQHKHFKQLVRARMAKTGERYAAARRQVLGENVAPAAPSVPAHFPGSVPAASALRISLAAAGVRAPHTGQPLTEAMVFGLAGGVGAGVFSFYYEKEDFASFFLAGRHLWQDDLGYLMRAGERLGLAPVAREEGGAKAAAAALRQMLEEHGPLIAWVDAAHLPHRAMPETWSGGAYHVITIYEADGDTALMGDLTDAPIPIDAGALADARARIKKR